MSANHPPGESVDRHRRRVVVGGAGLLLAGATPRLGWLWQPGPVTIRPYREADQPAVETLLAPRCHDEHPLLCRRITSLHRPATDPGAFHQTLVAHRDGALVGVASAMAQSWHPRFLLADVAVRESARRQRIGSTLLTALRHRIDSVGSTHLFAQIRPDWPGARPFAARHGFRHLMRSRQWRLDIQSPRTRAWWQRALQGRHGYRIVAGVDPADPRFGAAIRDLYDWMHRRWNPLGSISAAEVGQAFGPNVVAGSALLAFHGATVVGVGSLSRTPSLPSMRPFLSMVGATLEDLPRARELTAHLAALCVERAASIGAGLEAEADDAHRDLAAELEALPFEDRRELLQLSDAARPEAQ